MKEAYMKSTVYDMSGGLLPAPADDGFNIVMPVYTPTGPTAKTKVYSQKDFIDHFMTNTKMQPDDHESAQFAYMVLADNPVYVMRACPNGILEGMSCEGYKYLFDSEYHILNAYKQFKFDIVPAISNYSVSTDAGHSSKILEKPDLTELYEGLGEKNNEGILSASTSQIISSVKLYPSNNIGKFEESKKEGAFNSVTFLNPSGAEVDEKDFVAINGNTYMQVPSASSADVSPNVTEIRTKNPGLFGLSVLAAENCPCKLNGVAIPSVASSTTWVSGCEFTPAGSGTSSSLAVKSNNKLHTGSVGSFADPDIVVKGTSITKTSFPEGVQEGQKGYNTNDHKLYPVTATEKRPSSTTVSEYEYSDEETKANGTWWTDDTNAATIIYAKDENGNVIKYNLVLTGVIKNAGDAISEFGDGVKEITAETQYDSYDLGTICLVIDSSNNLTISRLVQKAKTVDSSGVAAVSPDSDIDCIKIDNCTYYNTNDVINSKFQDSCKAVPASTTSEFVMKVLAAANILEGTSSVTPATASGTVTLYVPSYGSLSCGNKSDGREAAQFIVDNSGAGLYYYYDVDPVDNDAKIKFDRIGVRVGDTIYFTDKDGIAPVTALSTVNLAGTGVKCKCNEADFMRLLEKALLDAGIYKYGDYFISTDLDLVLNATDESNYTIDVISEDKEQNPTELFALVPKFASKKAVFKYGYTYDDNTKIINLNFNYKDGVQSEDWTMSFVPGVIDGYGVDQWYTRVNSDYYQIVMLKDGGSVLPSFSGNNFGNAISVPEYDDSYMVSAINSLTEYEDGVTYDVISDAGVCSPALATACSGLAQEIFAVYPVSLPPYTKVKDYQSYVGAINGIHNYEARMLAASDRIAVSGFSSVFPGSYKLIGQMISAFRNPANEFAPNFDLNHGTVGMSNPVQSFKKKDREALLDIQVETLKGGITTPLYINDNTTAQSNKSYMSEDQNVRMTNVAVHTVESMVKNYVGELNTKALRNRVTENVNSVLQDRLFKGRSYSPAQYMAVCNDTNNTPMTIDQNQLVIDLYASFTPSVKYILINHFIVSLSNIS